MKSLQNISYKTLFTILFLSLAGIVFFIRIGKPAQKVSAAWWDEMWHYRKAISIENSSGTDLTDFQVSISIGTSQLVADGKMQTDCDDIRITDINGNLLPYWIETGTCNTNTTKILSRINSLPTSGSIVYIYYGNSTVVSATDATAVPQTCSKVNSYFGTNFYYINPEGKKNSIPVQAYCDMTTDGGGWTLVASWDTSQEWTKSSNSISDVFGTTPKNTVSSNFGNAPTNDFRILASDTITSVGTSAYADWYYHYNANTSWKEVWAPSANTGGNIESTYRSPSPRQAIQPFNYSYNIKFSYQVTQTWNNLSDWSLNVSSFDLPNYWLALTSPGNKFGVYSAVSGSGSNDGSLGICPSGSNNCITGQDMGSNQSKVGYDDNIPSASFGATATSNVGGNPPVDVTTKLWWFIRDGTPINKSYSVGSTSTEETGTGPIAYWKFDEGTGTTTFDSTSYQNNGNITGATWQNEDQCISGKCLNFDSAQNQYVLSNNTIPFTGSQTYSVWVYPKSTEWLMGILTTHSHANNSNIGINISTNKFSISIGYTDETREYQDRQSNFIIPINTWSHVELVYNNIDNSVTFYVNGKFDKQWVLAKTVKFVNDKILVGQWSNSYLGGYKFNGYIDEPKIYPYARTADQIKQDYNSRGSLSGAGVNLGVSSNTAPSLKTSLIAHWKFDEGSGTIVNNSGTGGAVLNGNFGIGDSSPSWGNEGKFGKTIVFNDSRYIVVSSNSILNTNDSVTVSAWIKTTDSSSQQTIVSRNGPFFLRLSGGKFRVGIYTGTWYFGNGNISINSNEWYHLALVYDGSFVKSYVNGILDISSPKTGLLTAFSNLYFGRPVPGGEQYPFYGNIDEVKIYNKALTIEEIKQDYNQGSSIQFGVTSQNIGGTVTSLKYCIPGDNTSCSSPIGEWDFEENTGLSTKDSSGSNNNGSFGSSAYSPAWVVGKKNEGASLQFDGVDDRVTLASTIYLRDNENWTVSAWVKTTLGGSILSNSSGGPVVNDIRVSSNKISYSHYSGTWLYEYGNINVSDGKWHHLTWVNHSNKTMDMYVDGVGDTYGVNSAQSSGPVNQIGRNWGGSFLGTIDQVKIYNYARTPAQIAYDYNKGEPIAWFKFDECQGNIVNNSSSIGITGIINIGSSGSQNTLGTCAVGSSAAWTNGSAGKINGSLNFDGVDDYVFFGDPANGSLDFGINDFTLSAWINSSVPQTSVILGKYYTYPLYYMRLTASGVLESRIGFDTSTNYSNSGTVALTDGKWHHVVSVFQRNGSIVNYLDGLPHGSPVNISASSTRTVSTTNSFTIGSSLSTQFFKGQIDDARVYNYALTAEQIKLIYNNGAINFN